MLSRSSRLVRTLNQVLVAAVLTLSTTLVAAKDNAAASEKGKLGISVSAKTKAAPAVKAANAMARVPLAFEANQGQVDNRVEYFSRGAGYTLFLTKDEAVLSLANAKGQPDVLRVKLSGTDAKAKVSAIERLGWNNNYFIGKDPAKWRTNVPNYRKVQFDNVYPGVSLVYYGNQRQLEHDFVVAPNADPKKIAMEIAGASDLTIDSTGNLVIKTTRGEVRFEKPVVYQDVNGARKDVAGKFILRDKKNVGFEIADYDRSKALVIDPVINFGTLLSASVGVTSTGVAVDGAGNSYVTGITQATSFPAPAPAAGTTATAGPSDDVYVVKVAADGSSLGYVSFIGSSGADSASGIALDGSNNAYLTGTAACTIANTSTDFPTTADAFQQNTTCPGSNAAFMTVLNPAGNALIYSTLYGGDSSTVGNGIAVFGAAPSVQAYITGNTTSSVAPLTVTANAFRSALSGTQDAFFARFNPVTQAAATASCSVAGTSTIDFGVAPNFYVNELVFVSGVTLTAGADTTEFNTGAGLHSQITAVGATSISYSDPNCTDVTDAGTGGTVTGGLVYGSYLGGAGGSSNGRTVVATANNSIFVGGFSTSGAFPTTVGAAQTAFAGGGGDGVITEFDPTQAVAASTVPASTYVGGSGGDDVFALAADGLGNLYATGNTSSTDFPKTTGGAQAVYGGGVAVSDAYVTKLPTTLASITQSTYLGGTDSDQGLGIAVSGGAVWVVGDTRTPTADNVFNTNAISGALSGVEDGFIARFNANLTTKQVATYFGGNGGNEFVNGIVATGADTVVVAGTTDSTDFYTLGGTTGSAFQTVPASANKAGFLAKFSANSTAIVPNFLSVAPINSTDPLKFDGTNNTDYTITLTNNDAAVPATSTTLDLRMDLTKLTVNTVTPTGMTCVKGQANASSGITCDAGTIAAAGGTAKVDVNVSAIPCVGACPATTAVTNISVGSAEAGSNTTSTLTSNILPVADIGLSAFSAAGNVTGGGFFVVGSDTSFKYQYNITNNGPHTAPSVTITNNLPAGFSASTVTLTVSGTGVASCPAAPQTGTFTCTITGFTSGSSAQMVLIGDPTSLLGAATARATNLLDFSANVGPTAASYVDGVPGNDSGSSAGNVIERVVALTANVTPTAAGTDTAEQQVGTVSYKVVGHNSGPSPAHVVVAIKLDTGVATNFTNLLGNDGAAGCAAAVGQTVTCTSASAIAASADYTITFTATAPATINGNAAPATQTFTVNNLATVSTTEATVSNLAGAAAANATSGFTANVERRSDLSVGTLTATAGPTSISGSISLDLTAGSSNINYAIPGTTVVYTLTPTGPATSFTSGGGVQNGSTTGAACVNTTPAPAAALTITCTVASLSNAGQAIHLVINAPTTNNVNAGTVSTAAFTSNACIAGPVTATSDPGNGCGAGSNNLSTTAAADPSSQVQRQADLDISAVGTGTSFAGAPGTVALAGPLTYTYRIRNNGPDTALNVLATIAETSTAVNTPLVVGAYSGATSCSLNGANIDCSIASIPATGSVLVTVPITPPVLTSMTGSSAAPTGNLSSTVALDPQVSTFDTTAGNNSNGTTVSSTLQRTADVDIKTPAFSGAPAAGLLPNTPASTATNITTDLSGAMSITFGLSNSGPDTALNVPVKLTNVSGAITTALAVSSSTPGSVCSQSGGNITCTVASVPTGPATTITVNFTPPTPTSMTLAGAASPSGSFTTMASITAPPSYVDGNAANDANAATVTTNLLRESDIQAGTFSATPAQVDLTGQITYAYNYVNAGPDPALKMTSRITLSIGAQTTPFTFVSAGSTFNAVALAAAATNGCVVSSSTTLDCEVDGPIAVGPGAGFIVKATPPLTTNMAGGAKTDAMTSSLGLASAVWDDGAAGAAGANNAPAGGSVGTSIQRQADLSVNSVVATPFTSAPASSGPNFVVTRDATIHYVVSIQNLGPSDAINTVLTLNLPTGSALPAQPAGCGGGSAFNAGTGVETCNFGSLTVAAGAQSLTFIVTPPALASNTASTALSTSASIGSTAVIDNATANNSSLASPIEERDIALNVTGMTETASVNNLPGHFVVDQDVTINYGLTLQNSGPSDATNVVLTANFPVGSALTGGQPGACGGGSAFNAVTGVETCNIGTVTVASGASTINFLVTPPALAANVASTPLNATASLTTNPISANNSGAQNGNVNVTQERDINLSVTGMTETPNTGSAGSVFVVDKDTTITYAIGLSNTGPSNATNVVLTTNFPVGSALTGGQPGSCGVGSGFNAGTGVETCNLGAVPNGASPVVTFVVTPPALSPNSPSATLPASTLVSTSSATNSGTPNGSVNTTQERDVNLSVNTVTETPNTSSAGNVFVADKDTTISYAVSLSNAGPSNATNVVLTATFAVGSALSAQPAACGAGSSFNAGTAVETCNIGAMLNGATPSVTFVVTPPALASNVSSATLPMSAIISTSPASATNTSLSANGSVNTTQERDINLSITTMTESPNLSGLGNAFVVNHDSTITYTIGMANSGPSNATNVVLTVNVPSGSVVSPLPGACGAGSGVSGNGITCNVGAVANGATPSVAFVVTPPALAANSPSVVLSATAGLTTTSANNISLSANSSVNTTQERQINLTIPSMASTPNVSGSGKPFVVTKDSTISYAITLNNAGPSDATNAVLTVNLPAGSTAPDPGTCLGAGGFSFNAGTATVTCNIGTITNGASPVQAFVVTPPALAAGTTSTVLAASASVTTSPVSANNTAANSTNNVSITQERDADLGVTISVPATTLSVGPGFDSVPNGHQQVTYTIVATNNGPSDATDVKVTDVLPAGFNFTSFTSTLGGVTCTGAGSPVTVTCDFGTAVLSNGATNTITITATATAASLPAAQASNVVSDNASIASTTLNDPTPANNSTTSPALVTLHGEADISISGITATPASGATLHVGDDLIYGVTVHNVGPHPTQLNLAFSDVLPAGVTPVSVTPGSGTTNCVLGATTTCTMTTGLAIGGSETVNIRVHVPATAVGALSSNATIDTPANPVADEEDSALGNNTLGNSTTALAAADLQLTEAAVPNPTLAGTSTTFTVTIANLAPPAYVPGSPVVGGSNATGVTVRNVVTVTPASPTISISSITNNFGATCPASATLSGGTATINCTGGNVTSGASNTITLTTTPSVIGTLTNVATITAANEFDPVNGNNSISATDREDNTPVCSGAGCTAITPVDPVSGNSPLSLPQSATVQFTNVTTQGSTTMTVAAQPASCQILDPTTLPAGSTLINNSTHVPFHGILPDVGSRTYACGSGAPLYYNIATTAVASGTANVCVNYSGTTFHKADRIRLVEVSGSAAQDITIASGFSATTICGQLPSFTSASGTITLAVVEPSNAMPDLTAATATPNNSAAARGAAGNAVDLSAAGTFDNDGPDKCVTGTCSDTLTYRWFSTGFLGSSTVTGKTVTVPVSATGTVNILLTATDPYGDSETRLFTLTFTGTLGSGSGSGSSSGGFVTSATVNKGQAASFTTALDNPTGGAVSLFVANAASLATNQIVCTISPNTLPAGSTGTAVTVLCSTQGQIFAKMDAPQRGMGKDEVPMLAGMVGITALPLMGMLLMPGKSRRKKLLKMWAAIGLVLMFTMFQAACGGGGVNSFGGAPTLKNAGTPSAVYQVIIASNPAGVTGSSAVTTGTVAGSTTFTLTVQ